MYLSYSNKYLVICCITTVNKAVPVVNIHPTNKNFGMAL